MNFMGLEQLRKNGVEDAMGLDIDWQLLNKDDVLQMESVVDCIPDWECEYNRLVSQRVITSEDDGAVDTLATELVNAYSIRETMHIINAVTALTA